MVSRRSQTICITALVTVLICIIANGHCKYTSLYTGYCPFSSRTHYWRNQTCCHMSGVLTLCGALRSEDGIYIDIPCFYQRPVFRKRLTCQIQFLPDLQHTGWKKGMFLELALGSRELAPGYHPRPSTQCDEDLVNLDLTRMQLWMFSFRYFFLQLKDVKLKLDCFNITGKHRDDKKSKLDSFDITGKHQDDPMLIEYVRRQIKPPSAFPYNLVEPRVKQFSTIPKKYAIIKKLLGEMHNGFFIEVGAYDGETGSNSLYWERDYGWSGLVIEPEPTNYKKLMKKHRKAFTLNACLCLTKYSELVTFTIKQLTMGKIVDTIPKYKPTTTASIPCYPFTTIIAALGFPPINYLSLDIEGHELKVLRTLPSLRDFDIRVILVEHKNLEEGFPTLKHFMEVHGYTFIEKDDLDGLFYKNVTRLV